MTSIDIALPALLNSASITALRHSLDQAYQSDQTRVIVLRGGAQTFCRGMDLAAAGGTAAPESGVTEFAACLERIRLGPKPVVALVGGAATAGGVGIAAAADLVLASPNSTFALTELLFGLLPAVILPFLAERIGPARARLWGLSTHEWSAAEAQAHGLVDVVAPTPDLERPLRAWVRRLARAHPDAAALWKLHTAEQRSMDPRHGATVTIERLRDPFVLAGLRRFTDSGETPWTHPS